MDNYKILAKVKFNSGIAVVLNKRPLLKFYRTNHRNIQSCGEKGNLIYGTDGLFYDCYFYKRPGRNAMAFGGRKFTINLENGESVDCHGQWWDGAHEEICELLKIELTLVTFRAIEDLKKCYVFAGCTAEVSGWNKLLNSVDMPIHEYREYEKKLIYEMHTDERAKLMGKMYQCDSNGNLVEIS